MGLFFRRMQSNMYDGTEGSNSIHFFPELLFKFSELLFVFRDFSAFFLSELLFIEIRISMFY